MSIETREGTSKTSLVRGCPYMQSSLDPFHRLRHFAFTVQSALELGCLQWDLHGMNTGEFHATKYRNTKSTIPNNPRLTIKRLTRSLADGMSCGPKMISTFHPNSPS
jgi:hypothetical protein